jgi:transcriptional regulator with XRE-family HTH domain
MANDEDELLAFGRRLELARVRTFRFRARLARASGLLADTIRTYEEGRNYPSPHNLRKLRDALGVTADWLYWGDTRGLSVDKYVLLAEGELPKKAPAPPQNAPAQEGKKRLRPKRNIKAE